MQMQPNINKTNFLSKPNQFQIYFSYLSTLIFNRSLNLSYFLSFVDKEFSFYI